MQEGVRCRDIIWVGPAWLQQYSCKFIMDMKLKMRGGRHANAKRGK
jgi:hypothetical protein